MSWLCCVLLCFWLAQPSDAARACEESGYCSVGVSKHWVGEITRGAQLRSMLLAVAHKKELIITIFQASGQHGHGHRGSELWADQHGLQVASLQALQLHSELQSQGYGHFLFISSDQASCDLLNKYGPINCAWDGSELPGWVLWGEQRLWHNRWTFLGRAARLGYNVMSVDTDFIFYRDPYRHLKREPFMSYQVMGAPESDALAAYNGGFIYVHNTKPDGPVTWAFKQIAMSPLRRADDRFNYTSRWTKTKDNNCVNFDQSLIEDALTSAAVGHPAIQLWHYRMCKLNSNINTTTRAGNSLTTWNVFDNMRAVLNDNNRKIKIQLRPDPDYLRSTGVDFISDFDCKAHGANLTVPNLNLGYPEELGGRYAAQGQGNYSTAFIAQLKDDCPDCPWWPERRPVTEPDPLPLLLGPTFDKPNHNELHKLMNLYHDPNIKQERLLMLPAWFTSSMWMNRRGWVLGLQAPFQGPQVMGHAHAWPVAMHKGAKLQLRKIYGRYNWTLGSYLANKTGLPTPYSLEVRTEVTRVLALSPRVDLSRTRSWEEYATIVTGLMQVAFLSHRVLVLPDLPCETAWFHDTKVLQGSDEEHKRRVCIAPTFWQDPYRGPWPVPYAVDKQGEMIGGWARRLRQIYNRVSRHSPAYQQPAVPPLILDMKTHTHKHADTHTNSRQHTGQRGLRWDVGQGESGDASGFWERQKYRVILPGVWDMTCTRDMHALIPPEFAHWLKHTDAGRAASKQPTTDNVAFRAADSTAALTLRPPLAPGGDSSAVPVGSVVTPSKDKGWSWYDVMGKVSVSDAYAHLNTFSHVPLLFVDHPVMVTHTTSDPAADAEWHKRDADMKHPGHIQALQLKRKEGNSTITPDDALSQINYHIRHGQCKANWVEQNTHKLVDLAHGTPCTLVGGVLQPV